MFLSIQSVGFTCFEKTPALRLSLSLKLSPLMFTMFATL